MDILSMVDKAVSLIDEGIKLSHQVAGEINDAGAALKETDLEAAKERLAASLVRARQAHDNLDAAIAKRLGE